jgi:16S rRNA processing protein RimM
MNARSPGGTILRLGVVMRPHGLRGAFTVKPSSPGPPPGFLDTILLQFSGEDTPVEVPVRTWKSATSGHWIVESPAFTLERAETARNALVLAPAAAFGPLADDEVWLAELLGATVVWPDGVARGTVTGVLETPAPYPVLILADPAGREVFLPLPREHFISFDANARVLVVSTPDP